ncbi:MAG: FtsL-like putative cell division protein [Prevotella sp.]|nr:FtsL-like putative cell division protein [Prevotella sp.]
MKEDNPITDAIKVDVTNTEDNAKGEQMTGETAAAAEPTAAAAEPAADKPTAQTKTATAPETADDDVDSAPSLRTIIRQQAIEDELPLTKNVTLGKILGGEMLNTQFLRQQIWVIVLITLFIIVYISNRYKCQQNLIKIDNLQSELEDAKYRALSSSSDLTQQTRESKVLERLHNDKDSTLHIPTQPPYIITIPNQEEK